MHLQRLTTLSHDLHCDKGYRSSKRNGAEFIYSVRYNLAEITYRVDILSENKITCDSAADIIYTYYTVRKYNIDNGSMFVQRSTYYW